MNSTYSTQSQQLTQVFADVPLEKILVVPLDFAKASHTVRMCLGTGHYLHNKAMDIKNNKDGIDYLCKRISQACSRNKIKKNHVIIASEDAHSYAKHFLYSLKMAGYAVVEVNAAYAKTLRKGNMASSDSIDLDGIANAVLNRRAKDLEEMDELYPGIKRSSRSYKNYKKDLSAMKNRIGKIIDELSPGFLNKLKSGIEPFSRASICLMSNGFSLDKIRRMKPATLVEKLKKSHLKDVVGVTAKLQAYSAAAIAPPKAIVSSLSISLSIAIELYKALEQACFAEKQLMVELLVQTPYVVMLSIPGIGVVRAAVFAAELKAPATWHTLDQTCAYAGIASRSLQTGGAAKPAENIGLPKSCNHRLKDAILQAAHHTGMQDHYAGRFDPKFKEHRLKRHYTQVTARGGKSGLSTGRLIFRLMRGMVKSESLYLPNHSQGKEKMTVPPEELLVYISATFNKIDNTLKEFDLKSIKNNRIEILKKQWQESLTALLNTEVKF